MKLLTYLFKEESRFDTTDMYKVNITRDRLDSLKKSKSTYEANAYEIQKLEEMVEEGEMQIPSDYFLPPIPVLFLVEKDDKNEALVFTKESLKKFMYSQDISILKNDNIMYVEIVDGELNIHGIQQALSSSSKSGYLFTRTNERDACRVYTGIDLKLTSGKVKVYGRSFGYKLEVNPEYASIVNQINNRGKEYITEVIYQYEPQNEFKIETSLNVLDVLDNIKDEVHRKDMEVFLNVYSKVKSRIPLETDYIIENPICEVRIVKNGKAIAIPVEELPKNFYTDINGDTVIMKVNGKFKLVENFNKENVKVSYKYRPTKFKTVKLLSKDSFVVATSKTTGIRCRIEGTCTIPYSYEEIT